MNTDPLINQMQTMVRRWEDSSDRRAIFLSCYCMMTSNMMLGLQAGEFHDQAWVDRLLRRFADYYFVALKGYEQLPPDTPAVWRVTFEAALQPATMTLQNLLLGVNAHINYDLVLTLREMLETEWGGLSPEMRKWRYTDHCHVNDVIGRTIDSVQDEVVEEWTPGLDLVDKLLGPLDEWLISRLITGWREEVWQNAVRLVELSDAGEREKFRLEVERNALQRAQAILQMDGLGALRGLI
jgi:hypothetical protein